MLTTWQRVELPVPQGCSECLAGVCKRSDLLPEDGAEMARSNPERLPLLLASLATERLDGSTEVCEPGPRDGFQPCLRDSEAADSDMPQPKAAQ